MFLQSRQSFQQTRPGRSFVEAKLSPQFAGERGARRSDSVIEAQNPNPPAVENMMHRGVIDGKREMFIAPVNPLHGAKVSEQRFVIRQAVGDFCKLEMSE